LEIENLQSQLVLLHRAGEVTLNFGGDFANSISAAIENFAHGAGKLKEVFTGLGESIFKQISDGLAKSLVEKLGFDKNFILNMQGLGSQSGDLIHQGIGGGLTGALGNIG